MKHHKKSVVVEKTYEIAEETDTDLYGWISVKDKLPPMNTPVFAGDGKSYQIFIYTNYEILGKSSPSWLVYRGIFDYSAIQDNHSDFVWVPDYESFVTHWTPLPNHLKEIKP